MTDESQISTMVDADLRRELDVTRAAAGINLKTAISEAVALWISSKRNPDTNRATVSKNDSTTQGIPAKDLGNHRSISTLVSGLSDKLQFVCDQQPYGPDTLGWYMRKLAEILSTVSVDDDLALRFLSEAADIKVKVDGGSISITGSVGNKGKGKGRDTRAENAAVREGMGKLRQTGAEYPGGEGDSSPVGKNPRRKTR